MAIVQRDPPNWALNADVAQMAIDDMLDLWTTTATIRRAPTAMLQWIYIIPACTTATKTEQNSVCSVKSEAELAVDVL